MKIIVSLIAVLALSEQATAFVPWRRIVAAPTTTTTKTTKTAVFAGSREEEIAKLEEQLRKLREEEASAPTAATTVDGSLKNSEINAVEQRILEKVKGKDMILSERELYDDNIVEDRSTEGGSIVQTILAAVAAIVVLGIFAQIPIGDEGLSKYSAQSGPTMSRSIDLGDLNTDAPKP
eukprot:scaffold5952_cov154-Amphora_coffeaeformis.AAC.1